MVLGVFVATFLVPHLAVNVAVLLAVLDVGVLVHFIHHISDSIQVPTMAGRVRSGLVEAVDRLYPLPVGDGSRRPEDDPEPPVRPPGRVSSPSWWCLLPRRPGR